MKLNLVLLAAFLAAPIFANTIPEVSEAVDLADRDMSAVEEGNQLTARKVRFLFPKQGVLCSLDTMLTWTTADMPWKLQ
ncbi:hypothetical protein TRV_03759 [Trichophyton verrucosum HKI 0517]|uniref:Uncharacterized protein n=1 Tax=Trichophyton verrucosum (strain HKI 0517) TaxID=663202 RepID=D4D9G6_TRIVH|nr:uncharacterized protein TRV_03759 [Trichophyton verrucosum HKI 0517]EFE41496.1 hypothetical protein TRV_03759 [Trichophyton verrucosum HKI 0517]